MGLGMDFGLSDGQKVGEVVASEEDMGQWKPNHN
jgi:hypothetical protein